MLVALHFTVNMPKPRISCLQNNSLGVCQKQPFSSLKIMQKTTIKNPSSRSKSFNIYKLLSLLI